MPEVTVTKFVVKIETGQLPKIRIETYTVPGAGADNYNVDLVQSDGNEKIAMVKTAASHLLNAWPNTPRSVKIVHDVGSSEIKSFIFEF